MNFTPISGRREHVAAALYRAHRINEARQEGHADPEVYAGWFPWDNLGTSQAHWLTLADAALVAATTFPNLPDQGDDCTHPNCEKHGKSPCEGVGCDGKDAEERAATQRRYPTPAPGTPADLSTPSFHRASNLDFNEADDASPVTPLVPLNQVLGLIDTAIADLPEDYIVHPAARALDDLRTTLTPNPGQDH